MMSIILSSEHVDTMIRHARRTAPEEACGLLVGWDNIVEHVKPCENIDHSPCRWTISAREFIDIEREAATAGLDLLGCWYSRCGPPVLSQLTIRHALYHLVYVVLGFVPRPALGAFLILPEPIAELAVVVR
jgi:proteasome lid subunit RPN8/RPN11